MMVCWEYLVEASSTLTYGRALTGVCTTLRTLRLIGPCSAPSSLKLHWAVAVRWLVPFCGGNCWTIWTLEVKGATRLGWGSLWDLGGSQRALIGQVECVALIFNINGHSHNLYSVPFFSCHCYNEVLCHVVFTCHTFFLFFIIALLCCVIMFLWEFALFVGWLQSDFPLQPTQMKFSSCAPVTVKKRRWPNSSQRMKPVYIATRCLAAA